MGRKAKPENLPQVIKELVAKREGAGITKQELADRLGYSLDSVHHWENGRIHPSFQSLLNWCDFFGVTLKLSDDSQQ